MDEDRDVQPSNQQQGVAMDVNDLIFKIGMLTVHNEALQKELVMLRQELAVRDLPSSDAVGESATPAVQRGGR